MIFTLQYLDLRKIDEAEADISHAKEALNMQQLMHNQNTSLTQNTQHDTCMAFELDGCCHQP